MQRRVLRSQNCLFLEKDTLPFFTLFFSSLNFYLKSLPVKLNLNILNSLDKRVCRVVLDLVQKYDRIIHFSFNSILSLITICIHSYIIFKITAKNDAELIACLRNSLFLFYVCVSRIITKSSLMFASRHGLNLAADKLKYYEI